MNEPRVEQVVSSSNLGRFVALPWQIYRNDPLWTPPLRRECRRLLDPQRNPFFEHGDMGLFLAHRGGIPIGRIAAIRNDLHNEKYGDRLGFFGFFECINDPAAAACLFEATERWLSDRGLAALRGPVSPSMNAECGLVTAGHNEPARIMMPYNPAYYATLFEAAGFAAVKQLVAYHIERAVVLDSPRLTRVASALTKSSGVTIRPIDMKKFERDVQRVCTVYNTAWRDNWGFVPMTDREATAMATELKPLVDPSLVLIAEVGEAPVAVAFALRDYNVLLRRMNGRLFPLGLIRLLLGRRNLRTMRLVLLGVIPTWRRKGIDAALCLAMAKSALALGIEACEGSWVLEDNSAMNAILPTLGARAAKRMSMYERTIGSPKAVGATAS